MISENRKKSVLAFGITLVIVIAMFATTLVKTNVYNNKVHKLTLESAELFSSESQKGKAVSFSAVPRSSTWGKTFRLLPE